VGPNYIALAVPFFFVFIAVELAATRGRRRYRFADAVTDLGCGVGQRVTLLFYEALLLVVYTLVYRHARLFELEARPALAWLVAMLGVDFIYYWWHRASHRVNVLWAAHIVHHQSEDYNLAVALRQGALTPVTALPFNLPLALLGVPPLVYVIASAVNTLYQFWIHTESVRSLGPLEAVLNTPSHHRVHHGRNPQYLDRNYGAILIVWDRLFGTFAAEREPVIYGITTPLRSFNPLWAQVHHFVELARQARVTATAGGGWRTWFLAPDRVAERAAERPAPAPGDPTKYDVPLTGRLAVYVLVNFAAAVAITFVLMMWQSAIPSPWLVIGATLVLMTTASLGGLMERKPWARPLEVARLASLAAALPALALLGR
jgi:sterol desaturase/sphingolipid hydroxylase (fatty acid hydroxylase superfamily)